jgi:hypothetical protein
MAPAQWVTTVWWRRYSTDPWPASRYAIVRWRRCWCELELVEDGRLRFRRSQWQRGEKRFSGRYGHRDSLVRKVPLHGSGQGDDNGGQVDVRSSYKVFTILRPSNL